MDELLQMLICAQKRLAEFNETVNALSTNLEEDYRALPPHSFDGYERADIENVFQALHDYLITTGVQMDEYLQARIRILKLYLYE